MRLDLIQNMRLEQRMKLAPRMIQSMEILQLPIMALQDRIQQEIEENVVLEVEGLLVDPDQAQADDGSAEATAAEESTEATESAVDAATEQQEELERLLMLNEEWSELFEPRRTSRARVEEDGERKHDAMQNMASRPQSLAEYLLDQFAFFDCTDRVREFGGHIIENLNSDGFCPVPLEDLIATFGGGISRDEAEQALDLVQKLDPRGVGARDLRECLLLQLAPDDEFYEVLHTIVSQHLDDALHNRLPLVERKTGYAIDTIKAALEHLNQLQFRPGAALSNESAPQVIPDVIVERGDDGQYQVRLTSEHIPSLRISRFHQQLLRGDTDRETREYIQKKIQSARWLIDSIEQRQNTLRKVAQAIVDHQSSFLEHGPQHIEPLKMQQIADRVGVHVTTVSRAVDDKWIQTPRGIFPLKRFFGGGTVTADGEAVAWDIVRQKLVDIVDGEDKNKPYSDEQLAKKLSEAGFDIARRTVTKYREKLGIPKKAQRKQY